MDSALEEIVDQEYNFAPMATFVADAWGIRNFGESKVVLCAFGHAHH